MTKQERWRANHKEKRREIDRNYHRLQRFGITKEEFDQMLLEQNGVCAICKKPETRIYFKTKRIADLAVDHNHATDDIRGLLCSRCNCGLGMFLDNPDLLLAAIDYLKRTS